MPTITIRLTDEEKRLITNYVEIIGETPNNYIKVVTLEAIADHYDIAWMEENYDENEPTMTIEEFCEKNNIKLGD